MRKVLIIEDQEISRKALKRILDRGFEFKIFEAANGIDGLDIADKEVPDLVLLDIMMPLMDGREFLDAIRANPKLKHIPVIVLTTVNQRDVIYDMLKMGVSDYLLKPYDRDVILVKLNDFFAKTTMEKRQKQAQKNSVDVYNKRILIASDDRKFQNYMSFLFKDRLTVEQSFSGAECLKKYVELNPDIVCITPQLPVMDEVKTAKKLRDIDRINKSSLYYFSPDGKISEEAAEYYDDVLEATYNPVDFVKNFSGKVLGLDSMESILEGILKHLHPAILKIVKQSLSGAGTIELTELTTAEAGKVKEEMFSGVFLMERSDGLLINVTIIGSHNDLTSITKKAFQSMISTNDGVISDLSHFATTVALRLQTLLNKKGIATEKLDAKVQLGQEDMKKIKYQMRIPLAAGTGEKFIVSVGLHEGA